MTFSGSKSILLGFAVKLISLISKEVSWANSSPDESFPYLIFGRLIFLIPKSNSLFLKFTPDISKLKFLCFSKS